jgi:hypothetical protein
MACVMTRSNLRTTISCLRSDVVRTLPCFAMVLLVACGGGDGSNASREPSPPIQTIDLAVAGQAVIKARTAGNVVALLEERLTSIFEQGPQRTLSILQTDGRTLHSYASPAGWSVIDFAVHPSGDISAVLTTLKEVRIVRLNRDGAVRSDQLFLDPAAATDPYFDYEGGVKDDGALQPVLTHDAARVAPLGESLAVVLRTGRNAIVAYRLDPDASGAYRRTWRTLVEPGSSILLKGITSGSFDVFDQLVNHLMLFVDVDTAGTLAVGVVDAPFFNFTFRAHAEYFGEPIAASVGVLLTRVGSADGQRMGTTAVDTSVQAELHAVRATPRGFMMVGRVLSEVRSDGTGWNAFTALVGRDGTSDPYSVIDVDRGDVLFDIAALPGGRYLALGTTGYVQNPAGASISEDAQPLLALLNADGSLAQSLAFTGGARHNQLRTVASLDGRWLFGGMFNGPGTHSGDVQRQLITADGFLLEKSGLPTD